MILNDCLRISMSTFDARTWARQRNSTPSCRPCSPQAIRRTCSISAMKTFHRGPRDAQFGTPFFIYMFRQFFAQIPEALIEAARVDGCGHLRTWFQIMLPLCKPVIAITAIFTFIGVWNDFMGPLIFLQSEEKMTLAVALNSFQNTYGDFPDAHYLMAASIVTMVPCIVLFFVAQKQFVSGLSLGAVKG